MQLHKRFTTDQVRALLQGYCQGVIEREAIADILGIGKTRFFALLEEYRHDPEGFSLVYERRSPKRLSARLERAIEKELQEEKRLIDDPELPITTYNYSALRDRLCEQGMTVALSTLIERAKEKGYYQEHPRRASHDREVLTTCIGALIQHDASHHRWSPYVKERWVLITSLDDFSRKLLYADFREQESTWAHIQATEHVVRRFGIPLQYYVDSLRVFRFIQGRDSFWRNHVLKTDEADPQWRQVMRALGVEVIYALSPQAKGKIERPYRWLQDRIVRTCAREKLTRIDEVRAVLHSEVDRYNNRQVHSTTGEIPAIRFKNAQRQGNSLLRPFTVPFPYSLPKDVFCLREKRRVNGYRRISLANHDIVVPGVPLREEVDVHCIPNITRQVMEVRIWWLGSMVQSLNYPLKEFPRVHF